MPRKAIASVAVLTAVVFAGLWIGVALNWSWLTAADTSTLGRFHDFGVHHPLWIRFWRLVSDVLSPNVLRIAGLVCIVIALIRRRKRVAGFLAVTVIPAGLVTAVAKGATDRPRPETALTHAASSSFPSGHALGITVGVLALGVLLWPRVTASMRVPMIALGAALIGLVGLSRVALNVHYPSDVVAGCALGLLYYLLCVLLVPPRVTQTSAV